MADTQTDQPPHSLPGTSPAPRAVVLRTEGTNCDQEMVRAFRLAGAEVDLVHVGRVLETPQILGAADLIGFPGGFSHGDDIASGRVLAARLRERAWSALVDAADRGVPMIGACNGFQVMVQVGLLPGPAAGEAWTVDRAPAPTCALAHNTSARFVDRWTRVRYEPGNCVWTEGLAEFDAEVAMLPVAHGEGRFVAADGVLDRLESAGQVVVRYAEPLNGSQGDVAGIADANGRIFGLMPHPERYLDWTRHPWWTRLDASVRTGDTPGLCMFRSAVRAAVNAVSSGA
ncbi:MAG: phosphoribosylformylglycinamidine synthase I [Planctomycetota bacterium]